MPKKTNSRMARDLHQHHDVVRPGGLANAAHQDHRQQQHDDECRDVEAEVPTRAEDVLAGQVLQAERQVGGRKPLRIQPDAQPVEQVNHVRGEPDRHAHVRKKRIRESGPSQ